MGFFFILRMVFYARGIGNESDVERVRVRGFTFLHDRVARRNDR